MKPTFNFNLTGLACTYIFAVLLLYVTSSCNADVDDEPVFSSNEFLDKTKCDLADFVNDSTATILVLHKDPEYGRTENSGVAWKAFLNSEDNIDMYLKPDGYISVWNGANASNFLMDYNDELNEALIQPWPYIGNDGTVINKEGKRNIYTTEFHGESYYMFNPIVVELPSENPKLVNYRNNKPIKYVTLFCDMVDYGSFRMNNFEPEDENFYLNSNLPLPVNGLERNKIYIYILDDEYNFFEYGRRAGLYSIAADIHTASHPNEDYLYTLIEYTPSTGEYYRLH